MRTQLTQKVKDSNWSQICLHLKAPKPTPENLYTGHPKWEQAALVTEQVTPEARLAE